MARPQGPGTHDPAGTAPLAHYPPPPGPAPQPVYAPLPPPLEPAPLDPEAVRRAGRRTTFFWDHLFPYLALLGLGSVLLAIIESHLPQHITRLRYLSKWALLLLLLVPLLCWVAFHTETRRQSSFVFSRLRELLSAGPGALGRVRKLPAVLRILALGLFVMALARPQSSLTLTHEEHVEGIDIMIALDVSLSMQDRDLSGNVFGGKTRLDVAKEVIDDFINQRKNDRIGLVIFGKEAFSWCPPTLDYQALRTLLAEIRLGVINGRATAIGDALGTSINRLRRSKASSKVIILLTDGDDNSQVQSVTPNQAANFAATFKIKIFTILMGRHGKSGWGGFRRFRVNPRLLEEIAALTGGTPYLATDQRALKERFQRILNALKKDKLVRREHIPAEHYRAFFLPGLLLLGLELLLGLTLWRRFP
ncbi:MAG: VWA domain-containing protein [bacterium]